MEDTSRYLVTRVPSAAIPPPRRCRAKRNLNLNALVVLFHLWFISVPGGVGT